MQVEIETHQSKGLKSNFRKFWVLGELLIFVVCSQQVKVLMERFDVPKTEYPWVAVMEHLLEASKTTRREIQIVSWMLQLNKDRPGLKIKMIAEKKKAKTEGVYEKLCGCLLNLMEKVENGRDINV